MERCDICNREFANIHGVNLHKTLKHSKHKKLSKVVAISKERELDLENSVNEKIQYAFGYTEAWLQNTAKLHNIPEQYLAARVAELLLQSRKRGKYNLPDLRKKAA